MATDTLIGRALDEFVLREQIGQGATSVVYLADQPLLERQVVVKLSRHERGAESQGFLREARLASRIEHPFAAHIYGFGVEQDGLHWIAMERVRGTPLTDFIAQGPMDPEIAIPFVRRLCDVIHAAHELGVIHRDIKPDNTMVVSRGGTLFPKLLDLGVALDQRAGAAGSVGGRQGTPAYMAPECWVDPKFASVASDVYALGVLTYELLAGKRPFVAEKLMKLAKLHAREEPAPLPEAVPERARNAVYKALAKRATDRYQTVQAFADALIETSGVSMDVVGLPRLDELTLAAATSELPQPIADAVVLFDSAQTAQRALRASQGLLTTLSQVAGVVALAAADRLGAGHQSDAPLVQQLLSALQTRSLTPQEWWKLAREVCRPFAASPDVFPVPELVRMMFDDATQLTTAMDEWLVAAGKVVVAETSGDTRAGSTVTTTSSRAADAARTYLLGAMPAVSAALRSLQWLSRYRLATPSETGQARIWMGTRTLAGKFAATKAPVRHPCLLTAHDTIAVRLAPYVREAEPAAGEPAELFWVDGPGRADGEARHRALPQPYTMDAHGTWQAAGDSGSLHVDESPYMGLLTFSEADSRRYFGREKEVDAFVNRLRKLPWIAVAGPSGVGKSSFIRAGVLPSLDNAQRVVMRPGPTPLATLRATLEQHGVHMREHYLREADALARALMARITEAGWGTLVLVVDQFEELVTQCLDAAEQEQFAKLLVTLARDADSPLRIVLTVRDDFLVRVAGLAALRNVISANLQLLTTPAKEDLLRIVIEPARRAGFEFEDDEMPTAMVDEVAAMPGALAMLSFTCSKLWQLRDRDARRLTRAAYKSLGGVGGALAQHAESLLIAMPEAEQATVREVFRHLVSADGTRAALSRKELVQVAGGAAAESVIESLINGRLLLASEDAGGERVEVVHETLIINWPRLVTWRAQDAETARLRDQLRVAAKQWKERGGDKGLLWRGDALTEYQLWRSRYPGRLTDLEEDFGRQSIAAGKLRKKLTIGALATVLTAMSVAMVIFYGLRTKALASQERAEKSEMQVHAALLDSFLEQGRQALLVGNGANALKAFTQAAEGGLSSRDLDYMTARAKDPVAARRWSRSLHQSNPVDLQIGPNPSLFLSTSSDGDVVVADVKTGLEIKRFRVTEGSAWTTATWIDSETILAIASQDLRVFRLRQDGPIFTKRLPSSVWSLATCESRDGVAIGLEAGAIGLVMNTHTYETRSVRLRRSGPAAAAISDNCEAVAFASATNSNIEPCPIVVDVGAGAIRHDWEGQTLEVYALAFSPNANELVSVGVGKDVYYWSVRNDERRATLFGHEQDVFDVKWHSSGKYFATSSSDGTARIWSADSKRSATVLRGHRGLVRHVHFVPTRKSLFTEGLDGTLREWTFEGVELNTFPNSTSIRGFADGAGYLLSSSADGSVTGWDSVQVVGVAIGVPDYPRTATPLVIGSTVLIPSMRGLESWSDSATPSILPVTGISSLAEISNHQIAVGTSEKKLFVSNLQDHVLREAATNGPVRLLRAGPLGRRLLVLADTIEVYDAETLSVLRQFVPGEGKLFKKVEWKNETTFCAEVESDVRELVLFDVVTGEKNTTIQGFSEWSISPEGFLLLLPSKPEATMYSPEGKLLWTRKLSNLGVPIYWDGNLVWIGQVDGAVVALHVDTGDLARRLEGHVGSISSVFADEDRIATLSSDGTLRVWNRETGRELSRLAIGAADWATSSSEGIFATTGGVVSHWRRR